MNPSASMRRGAAFASLAVLCLLAAVSTCRAWATLQAEDAVVRQSQWRLRLEATGQMPTTAEWREGWALLNAAGVVDGGNPTLQERMAGYAVVRSRDGEVFRVDYKEAKNRLEQAVIRRPASGYSWANLAWVKYQLGETDPVLFQALSQAVQLGPWEPEVQWMVVDLGLALWDEMPASLKPGILTMTDNAMRRYGDTVMTIAAKRGRLAEVCGLEKAAAYAPCKQKRA